MEMGRGLARKKCKHGCLSREIILILKLANEGMVVDWRSELGGERCCSDVAAEENLEERGCTIKKRI